MSLEQDYVYNTYDVIADHFSGGGFPTEPFLVFGRMLKYF